MTKDNKCLAYVKKNKRNILVSLMLLMLVSLLIIVRIVWPEPSLISLFEYVLLDGFSQKRRAARVEKEIGPFVMQKTAILNKAGYEGVTKNNFGDNGYPDGEIAVKLLNNKDVKTWRAIRQVDKDYLEARRKRMSWIVLPICSSCIIDVKLATAS